MKDGIQTQISNYIARNIPFPAAAVAGRLRTADDTAHLVPGIAATAAKEPRIANDARVIMTTARDESKDSILMVRKMVMREPAREMRRVR